MYLKPTLSLCEAQLNDILYGAGTVISTESMVSTILDRVRSVLLSLVEKLKSSLSAFRPHPTELQTFLTINRASVDMLTQQPLKAIRSKTIVIPPGMRGTYIHTSDELCKIVGSTSALLDVLSSVRQATDIVSRLNQSTALRDRDALQKIYLQSRTRGQTEKAQMDDTLGALFDSENTLSARNSTVDFPNGRMTQKAIGAVLNLAETYTNTDKLITTLSITLNRVDSVIKSINPNRTGLTRDDLIAYAFIITRSAELMRTCGVSISLSQQVEHQFTKSLAILCGIRIA